MHPVSQVLKNKKMKALNKYLIAIIWMAPCWVYGQGKDTLKTDQINVIRAFEPEVNLVNKVNFPPNLPVIKTTSSPQVQKFVFENYPTTIQYTPEDLRPLRYHAPEISNTSLGYLKAGFGNYLTPVLDFSIANKNTEKYRTGLQLDFIYSKSKKPKFRQYYELGLEGFGEYYLENTTIGAKARLDMNQYYLYGMEPAEADLTSKKDISRKYTNPQFGIYFFNHHGNKWNLNFAGNVDVDIVSTDFDNKGANVKVDLKGYKEFLGDRYKLGVDLEVQHSKDQNTLIDSARTAVTIRPYGAIHKGIWSLEIGPVLLMEKGGFHVLPSIHNQVKLAGDKLVMYNEWNSRFGYNNLATVYRENPFISDGLIYRNYRFQERTILGLRGALESGFSYDARFGQHVWSDMPLFVNDTNDFKQFVQVVEDNLSAWNGHIELKYTKPKMLELGAAFDYYAYKTESEQAAWHMPEYKFRLSGTYLWKDKLTAGAEIETLGGIKVKNNLGDVEKLKTIVDINLHADYHILHNIAVFVELNNLLNNQHPRWNHYDLYGFHGIGGVKITF